MKKTLISLALTTMVFSSIATANTVIEYGAKKTEGYDAAITFAVKETLKFDNAFIRTKLDFSYTGDKDSGKLSIGGGYISDFNLGTELYAAEKFDLTNGGSLSGIEGKTYYKFNINEIRLKAGFKYSDYEDKKSVTDPYIEASFNNFKATLSNNEDKGNSASLVYVLKF